MKWRMVRLCKDGPEAAELVVATETQLVDKLMKVIDEDCAFYLVNIWRAADVGETVLVKEEHTDKDEEPQLVQVGGSRRWHKPTDSQDGYWVEFGEQGKEFPGLWSYDESLGVVVCEIDNDPEDEEE